MEQSILKLKYEDVYKGGTYLTIIEEKEIEKLDYRIKQIGHIVLNPRLH